MFLALGNLCLRVKDKQVSLDGRCCWEDHTSAINIPCSAPGYQSQGRTPDIFVLLWPQSCQAKPGTVGHWTEWHFTVHCVCQSLRLASLPESEWRASHLRASLPLPEEPELALMESETLEDGGVSKDHCFTPLCRTKEHLFNLKPGKYWVGQKVHSFFPPVSWL